MPAEVAVTPITLAERILRRDRVIAAAALAAMVILCWAYLAAQASTMRSMAGQTQMAAAMAMPEMAGWGVRQFGALALMWTIMMAGMMLPSAAPLILLVLGVYRRRGESRSALCAALFVAGYLLAWTVFSVVAAGLQMLLHRKALLSADMATHSAALGAAILLVAGAWQWLPLKNACLAHCRGPLAFLGRHWRDGAGGALQMGLRHGLYCIGCCWALMALLFFAGVMNLVWVAAIALFVLVEKLSRRGPLLGRVAGAALVFCGAYLLLHGMR